MMQSTNKSLNTTILIFTETESLVYQVVCCLIIFFGTVVNILIITMYRRNLILRSAFNFYMVNLSLSNIMQYLGFLPYLFVKLDVFQERNSTAGSLFCSITDGIHFFFVAAFTTVQTLVLMSILRYKAIASPFNTITLKKAKLQCAYLWLIGFVIITPSLFLFNFSSDTKTCHIVDSRLGVVVTKMYRFTLSAIGLPIPLLCMTITYLLIIHKLYTRKKPTTQTATFRKRNKITVLLGVLILVFISCWLPFGVYFVLNNSGFYSPSNVGNESRKLRTTKLCMAPCLIAGLLNFIFYALTNKSIRSAFIFYLNIGIKKGTQNNQNTDP